MEMEFGTKWKKQITKECDFITKEDYKISSFSTDHMEFSYRERNEKFNWISYRYRRTFVNNMFYSEYKFKSEKGNQLLIIIIDNTRIVSYLIIFINRKKFEIKGEQAEIENRLFSILRDYNRFIKRKNEILLGR